VHVSNFSFKTPSFPQAEATPGSNTGCRHGAAPPQFCLACRGAEATTATESPSLERLPRTLSTDGAHYFLQSFIYTLLLLFLHRQALLECAEILQISAGSRALPNHSHYLGAGNGHLSHVNLKTGSARAGLRGRSMLPAAVAAVGWFLGAGGFGGWRPLGMGGFGMGVHTTLGTTACAEPRGSINQPGRGRWPASRVARAHPCCCSNKIPRPCFFWRRGGWQLSLLPAPPSELAPGSAQRGWVLR